MANPPPDIAAAIYLPIANSVDWSGVIHGFALVAIAIAGLLVALVGLQLLLEFIDPEWAEQQRINREFERWKEDAPKRRAQEREYKLFQQFMRERENDGPWREPGRGRERDDESSFRA